MNRRGIVASTLAAGAGLLSFAVSRAQAQTGSASVPSVVYHLSELGRVSFVLGNIGNHFDGMGGPDKVRIALVVHGPPLMSFRLDAGHDAVRAAVARLNGSGLALYACSNTLKGMNLSLDRLLPGFRIAEKGGVVMLAELQGQGWAYLRP